MDFTIRIAVAPEDRRAVAAVAHAANRSTQPLAAYQASRTNHYRRSRATWWLLEEEGEAAAALVCHPLRFSIAGKEVSGFGLGSVATRPERRERGYASELCRHVAEACDAQGQSVGLLFSAIPPAFYERLGYQCTPAWDLRCEDPAGFAASGPVAPLRALDPYGQADALLALYHSHHTQHHPGLHLQRDRVAWTHSLIENPHDLFLGWGTPLRGDKVMGYGEMHPRDDAMLGRTAGIGIGFGEAIQGRGISKLVYEKLLERMIALDVVTMKGRTANPAVIHLAERMKRPVRGWQLEPCQFGLA